MESRIAEYRRATGVAWNDESIAATLRGFETRAAALLRGEPVQLGVAMGSCQCGDVAATLTMRDGIVWCQSRGREGWQRYDGPASGCRVAYGLGRTAQAIAAMVEGTPLPAGVYHASC